MAVLEVDRELDSGEARLNELGYKQELRRDLSGFHNFAIMFAVASVSSLSWHQLHHGIEALLKVFELILLCHLEVEVHPVKATVQEGFYRS